LSATTPVEKIVELLAGAGYKRLATPLDIAGLKFDFPAALLGTDPSPDLIIVFDTAFETEERVKNKIQSVARALDVMKSKRPLTTILAGPRPRTATLDAMSKVCRVLPIGGAIEGDEDAAIRNWLAVLMPLQLPQTADAAANPMAELLQEIGKADAYTKRLLDAASLGSEQVRTVLCELIEEPLLEGDTGKQP
jgi:hypothetical protein